MSIVLDSNNGTMEQIIILFRFDEQRSTERIETAASVFTMHRQSACCCNVRIMFVCWYEFCINVFLQNM